MNSFSTALGWVKLGKLVAREGWNGKGMHIAMQVPDENSKMTRPYIYMFTAQEELIPWLCSQTDMLAEDWTIVDFNLGD